MWQAFMIWMIFNAALFAWLMFLRPVKGLKREGGWDGTEE
jgi:hypothetical protein